MGKQNSHSDQNVSSRSRRRKIRNLLKIFKPSAGISADQPAWAGMETLEPRIMLTTWHVDASVVGPGTGTDVDPFKTITLAVTAAAATGDDILVRDGTYTEDLVIGKELTINSVNGKAATIIQLVTGVGIDLQAGANNAILGGDGTLNNGGFTITSDAVNTTFAVQLANAPTDVTISNNTIDTTGAASMGVSVGAAGATGLTVTSNTFTTDVDDGAFWGPSLTDATLNNNTIGGGGAYGIQTQGLVGTSTISSNVITGLLGAGGIVLGSGNGGTAGVTIQLNTITGISNGIRFWQGGAGDTTTVAILNNDLSGNDKAIVIDDGVNILASNFTVTDNSFDTSATAAIDFDNTLSGETLNAASNWWGSIGGPTVASNVFSTAVAGGAIISAGAPDVSYFRWYDAGDNSTPGAGFTPTGSLYAPVENLDTGEGFASIQDAIDDADTVNGNTIQTADGTFTEDVVIDKEITLQSENGAANTTTIQLVDGLGVDIDADNVTLGGGTTAAGNGFRIISTGATTAAIQVNGLQDTVTIAGNRINSEAGGVGVLMTQTTNLAVSGNVFEYDDSGAAMTWNPAASDAVSSEVDILNNVFDVKSGNDSPAIDLGLFDTVSITGNVFESYISVSVAGSTGALDSANLTISYNVFPEGGDDVNDVGVSFVREAVGVGQLSNVDITQNTFDNRFIGVRFGGNNLSTANIDWATTTIDENNFDTVASAILLDGAGLDAGVALDISPNYWGNNSGPIVAGGVYAAPGAAPVSGIVLANGSAATFTYAPWWIDLTGTGTAADPYAGTAFMPVQNVGTGEAFVSIQIAIDDADTLDGHTILAADGTFTEDLVVNKDLTISSANGMANTTIQLIDGVGIDFQAGAAGSTLGGDGMMNNGGFTVVGNAAATTFNVQMANAPAGVTIQNNTIDTTGNASMGISVGAAGADTLTVTDNTFTTDVDDGAFWGPTLTNATLNNNTIGGGGAYGIQTQGLTGTSTINNNTITGLLGAGGIVLGSGNGGTNGVTIQQNTITGISNGIRFWQGGAGDITTVTILNNDLSGNDKAIMIDDGANILPTNFTVTDNSFGNSTTAAIDFDNTLSGETLNAAGNWWGSAGGPTVASNDVFNSGGAGGAIVSAGAADVSYLRWYDTGGNGTPGAGFTPTGALMAPVTNTTQGTYFLSVQAAIDDAATVNGDVIQTADGTFTQDLDISKDLTVRSATGNTTLDIEIAAGVGIDISAGGVTLGGAANQGFNIVNTGAAALGDMVELTGAPAGVTISYNTIDVTGLFDIGIDARGGATLLSITNNAFVLDNITDIAVVLSTLVTGNVSSNTITGAGMGLAIVNPGGQADMGTYGQTSIDLGVEWYIYAGGTVTGSWDTLVPGEVYQVYAKVTNNGEVAATGTMDVNGYFHDAQASPGGAGDVMNYDDVAVNLAPGAFAYYGSGAWAVPTNDPGQDWYFVADISDLNFASAAVAGAPAISAVQDLEWEFGSNVGADGRTIAHLQLADAVGNPVYFGTTGAANGQIDYQATPANGYDVHMTNTDAATAVSVYYNAVIAGFDSDGPINYLYAPQSVVTGQVDIGAAGVDNANYYYVGSMTGGGQLNAGVINYIYTVAGGLDADVNLAGGGGWANITTSIAGDFAGTFDVAAGDVYQMLVTGDATSDVTLAGDLTTATIYGDLGAAGGAVTNWNVGGNLTNYLYVKTFMVDSQFRTDTGNMNAVYLGGMIDSNVFAGVNAAITTLPTVVGDYTSAQTIGLFQILGVAGVNPYGNILFQGSSVAASTLGTVSLIDADLTGGAVDYGVAYDGTAGGVTSLSLYQWHTDGSYYIWDGAAWVPVIGGGAGDLAVNVL